MKKSYYVDTCIWLNLFKKEINRKSGSSYWKIARDFIKQVEEKHEKIIVSTIVLKELFFILKEKFQIINEFFKKSDCIEIIKTNPEDYELARKWEKEHAKLSFYDYLHTAIAKRLNICLITRDEELILFAKFYLKVSTPEDLFS